MRLPEWAVDRLRQHRRHQAERRLALVGWDTSFGDLVCDNGQGGPLDPSAFTHAVKRFLRQIGKPEAHLHDVRHCVATAMVVTAGMDAATVAHWLGHSNAGFTLRRYVHAERSQRTGGVPL